jgi:hypothetical protein
VPAGTTSLQLNIVWADVPTTKASFGMSKDAWPDFMSFTVARLLFRREGDEQFRCASVPLEVAYARGGEARYSHALEAVHDPGQVIQMSSNPEDLDTWDYDRLKTVEAATTPMTGDLVEERHFSVEVETLPELYTRPDDSFNAPAVNTFTTSEIIHLMAPAPCLAPFMVFRVIGPGYEWEYEEHWCRSYTGRAYQIGSLPPGAYTATATENVPGGGLLATWNFTVNP